MQLSVFHETTYRYDEPPSRSTQYIRLTPFSSARQRVVNWSVELPARAVLMRDAFDNITHVLALDSPPPEIVLRASGRVDVDEIDDGEPAGRIDPRVFLRSTALTAADDAIRSLVDPLRRMIAARPLIGLTELMNVILERMPYESGITAVHHSAAQALATGAGVCQDHSHVFIASCREMGVACRYVSGYVYSSDFEQVASHAWAEAWIASRWVSFDVSNARHAGGAHIKLAIGLDYLDACPVRGVRLGGEQEKLSTKAWVRIHEQ
jgi:transglutaminase-like putative cysteine protease